MRNGDMERDKARPLARAPDLCSRSGPPGVDAPSQPLVTQSRSVFTHPSPWDASCSDFDFDFDQLSMQMQAMPATREGSPPSHNWPSLSSVPPFSSLADGCLSDTIHLTVNCFRAATQEFPEHYNPAPPPNMVSQPFPSHSHQLPTNPISTPSQSGETYTKQVKTRQRSVSNGQKRKRTTLSHSRVEWQPQVQATSRQVPRVNSNFVCCYCHRVAQSTCTSSGCDGRIRIRCKCGGKLQDGTSRMHSQWKRERCSVI